MSITLKQLQVFSAVAQYQQVNLAAKSLCITQPSASMTLRDLERQLSVELFDRHGNRLVINCNGRQLLPLTQSVLNQCNDIEQLFSPDNHKLSGTLNIGCSLTIGNYILPSILRQMKETLPGISPQICINNTRALLERVLSSELDIALVEGHCQHQDLHSEPWREDQMLIVAPSNHPRVNKTVKACQLVGETWVLREKGSGSREIFDTCVAPRLDNQYQVIEMQHTAAIINSVIEGLGITCISALAVQKPLQYSELVVLDTPSLDLQRIMQLVTRKSLHTNPVLQRFIAFCSSDFSV